MPTELQRDLCNLESPPVHDYKPQDILDAGLGDGLSPEGGECGGGNITHFKSVKTRNGSQL